MNTITQVPRALGAQPWWPRLLGLVAVSLFAMTIPMTRLANGSVAEPQWPPLFVACARAALAGCLALLHLAWARAPWPAPAQWPWLLGIVGGGVLAFPVGMGWAVRTVPAAHAAVLIGLLPLATAALAAWWLGHRPRMGFWLASVAGAGLVGLFVLSASSSTSASQGVQAGQVYMADACLLLAVLGAAIAYVSGAHLAGEMPAARVMSWSLLFAWPLTLPLAWLFWPADMASLPDAWARLDASAWMGLLYVSVVSTWLGFFFWYAALARDAMRVSQLQLLQPFMGIGLAACLLGEAVPAQTWLFAGAVLMTVAAGQRLARADAKDAPGGMWARLWRRGKTLWTTP